jgi:hypothetical protein
VAYQEQDQVEEGQVEEGQVEEGEVGASRQAEASHQTEASHHPHDRQMIDAHQEHQMKTMEVEEEEVAAET